ncbi:uncharacterized protein [Littorina saxatilis]|uniref:uncharacterized protein isoform X2 n=1 Tax=Littorina saxatilis TaxID=31220 RepID=UPI0038B48860
MKSTTTTTTATTKIHPHLLKHRYFQDYLQRHHPYNHRYPTTNIILAANKTTPTSTITAEITFATPTTAIINTTTSTIVATVTTITKDNNITLWSQLGSLQSSRDQLTAWLSPLSTTSPVVALASRAKELYNQGIWAYHYLHLSSPSHDRPDSITDSLRDTIMAEIRFRLRHFRFLQRSRITVGLPERGDIQAEICVPFPVRSLILTRPDLQKLWEDAQNNSQKLHHRRMRIQYKQLE